jgi:integrase
LAGDWPQQGGAGAAKRRPVPDAAQLSEQEQVRVEAIKAWRVLKAQGKPAYTYFYGKTYTDVKGKMTASLLRPPQTAGAKQQQQPQQPQQPAGGEPVFRDMLDAWLKKTRATLKESSYVKYRNLIQNYIKPALGQYQPLAVTNDVLNAFAADLREAGRLDARGGLAGNTVKGVLAVVKAALQEASINVSVLLPRGQTREMRVLSCEEQGALEAYLYAEMDACKLGILLCLYTGLRVGEMSALKWGDIRLQGDESVLTVRRTMQRVQIFDPSTRAKTKIVETDPKSRSSVREIPLPACVVEALTPFQPALPGAYLLTGRPDKYIEPRTFENKFKAYLATSGIREANFHCIRHTFATRCVELGFDAKTLSEILGHADIRITLERYVHPTLALKRSNMNKLNALHRLYAPRKN